MLRAVDRWLPGYLGSVLRRRGVDHPHLLICVADHFEPLQRTILADGSVEGGQDPGVAAAAVAAWCARYREGGAPFQDADGRAPVHTCFYPWDEYDAGCVDAVAGLVDDGLAELEIHLHHRHDTAEGLRDKLNRFTEVLVERHGLLGSDGSGRPRFGFVHGNWALANARSDGDWCGVNDELSVLRGCGCYADFTFPSAPSPTQPRLVNVPYVACDTGMAGAASRGRPMQVGGAWLVDDADGHVGLPIIPGPLGLNWRWRKWGLLPRLENGELSGVNPPTPVRLACWQRFQVHVPGRPEWIIIKLHTHGWIARNREMLLGGAMATFHRHMATESAKGQFQFHYVSARELFNIVSAAAAGCEGDPGQYRDYAISPPGRMRR
jgi:hypothetical protein